MTIDISGIDFKRALTLRSGQPSDEYRTALKDHLNNIFRIISPANPVQTVLYPELYVDNKKTQMELWSSDERSALAKSLIALSTLDAPVAAVRLKKAMKYVADQQSHNSYPHHSDTPPALETAPKTTDKLLGIPSERTIFSTLATMRAQKPTQIQKQALTQAQYILDYIVTTLPAKNEALRPYFTQIKPSLSPSL